MGFLGRGIRQGLYDNVDIPEPKAIRHQSPNIDNMTILGTKIQIYLASDGNYSFVINNITYTVSAESGLNIRKQMNALFDQFFHNQISEIQVQQELMSMVQLISESVTVEG